MKEEEEEEEKEESTRNSFQIKIEMYNTLSQITTGKAHFGSTTIMRRQQKQREKKTETIIFN